MDYVKLANNIVRHIENKPYDQGAYIDLLSLCRQWEEIDFQAAHDLNEKLRSLCAKQLRVCNPKEAQKFYEAWRKSLLFDAPYKFDAFMTYIELDRKPEKRFYAPRRHYLKPMVQGFQDIIDKKLRLLTISMPKRAGKSQTGINFVNMISGKYPDRATLMEGTGDDLVKSFYNGCLEYLTVPNEYLFYDVFPEARLVQTGADTKIINLKSKSRFPSAGAVEGLDALRNSLSRLKTATNTAGNTYAKKTLEDNGFVLEVPFARVAPKPKAKAEREKAHKYVCPICGQEVKTTADLSLICGVCEVRMERAD